MSDKRDKREKTYPQGGPGLPVLIRQDIGQALEAAILDLLSHCEAGKTICPSEAARLVDPTGWRALMEPTRAAAHRLVARGEILVTQRGRVVDPSQAKGPIRLRRVC